MNFFSVFCRLWVLSFFKISRGTFCTILNPSKKQFNGNIDFTQRANTQELVIKKFSNRAIVILIARKSMIIVGEVVGDF